MSSPCMVTGKVATGGDAVQLTHLPSRKSKRQPCRRHGDDASMHRTVIQRRSSMWAFIFDGIAVPLRAKNGAIAFAHFARAAGAVRNLCSTGETDCTCCRGLHRARALL